jgi:hypothetical protein
MRGDARRSRLRRVGRGGSGSAKGFEGAVGRAKRWRWKLLGRSRRVSRRRRTGRRTVEGREGVEIAGELRNGFLLEALGEAELTGLDGLSLHVWRR